MVGQAGPTLHGMPLFTTLGMIGYVGAFFNSVWIIVSIWRSSRG
jgi:ubiquinone biosynthesis protein